MVTAGTGLDALTQLIEPFVFSQSYAPDGCDLSRGDSCRAAAALRRVYEKPSDTAARQEMALASLFGGLALANAGLVGRTWLGATFAIGGMFPAPHEPGFSALSPTMAVNFRALPENAEPGHPALERYQKIAQLLLRTGNKNHGWPSLGPGNLSVVASPPLCAIWPHAISNSVARQRAAKPAA